jgi:hypothetical protein
MNLLNGPIYLPRRGSCWMVPCIRTYIEKGFRGESLLEQGPLLMERGQRANGLLTLGKMENKKGKLKA